MHLGLRSYNAIFRGDGALAQCSHSARRMQPFCPQAFFALDDVALPGGGELLAYWGYASACSKDQAARLCAPIFVLEP